MKFKNIITGEILSHAEFICFVWDETKRQFNDSHEEDHWSNLTWMEQIELYCEQYEHQTSGDWVAM